MPALIKWRKGSRAGLLKALRLHTMPVYIPGRGPGLNWDLPAISEETVPLTVSKGALPALVGAYEEYVDRYLITHDYTCQPRRWLHDHVPADAGVLEYVFPILSGSAGTFAAEVQLIRLIWLIQQCPGLEPITTPTEMTVNTTVGKIGIRDGRALFRFNPEGIALGYGVLLSLGLGVGHIRVFSNALNRAYESLDSAGKEALTLTTTRLRTKPLLRSLYDDGTVTAGSLEGMSRVSDKLLSMELALSRSESPAKTLQTMLVPEYMSPQEFRTLFDIPWSHARRASVTSEQLLRKMPLVQRLLESR